MDETIDLRPYVAALLRYVWLMGLAVLLAVIISIALFMMGDDYVATALVTVPEPAQQVQFDPRITTNLQSTQLLTAYPRPVSYTHLICANSATRERICGYQLAPRAAQTTVAV